MGGARVRAQFLEPTSSSPPIVPARRSYLPSSTPPIPPLIPAHRPRPTAAEKPTRRRTHTTPPRAPEPQHTHPPACCGSRRAALGAPPSSCPATTPYRPARCSAVARRSYARPRQSGPSHTVASRRHRTSRRHAPARTRGEALPPASLWAGPAFGPWCGASPDLRSKPSPLPSRFTAW